MQERDKTVAQKENTASEIGATYTVKEESYAANERRESCR